MNRRGFSAIFLVLLFVVFGLISLEGVLLYKKSHIKQSSQSMPQAQSYAFKPVSIDTTTWKPFEPFQGFNIKVPTDWEIVDSGKFGQQRADGLISNTNPAYITFKTTALFSKDISLKDVPGTTHLNTVNDVLKGARVTIVMTYRDAAYESIPANSTEDPSNSCKASAAYYGTANTQLLTLGSSKVCQVKIAANQYEFQLITDRFAYTTELDMSPRASDYQKNYYLSFVRALIQTYQPV